MKIRRSSSSAMTPTSPVAPGSPICRTACSSVRGRLASRRRRSNAFVAGHSDKPGARIRRHDRLRPLGQRGRPGVLGGVLGHLQVAHQASNRGDDGPPVGPKNGVELPGHRDQRGMSMTICGRTSTDPYRLEGIMAAHFTASSRSAHSRR
jgi:hypothetical protein